MNQHITSWATQHVLIPGWRIIRYLNCKFSRASSVKVLVVSDSVTPQTVPTRLTCPWSSPGKNAGVGCRFLLWGISLTQGLSPGLLHCRRTHYHYLVNASTTSHGTPGWEAPASRPGSPGLPTQQSVLWPVHWQPGQLSWIASSVDLLTQ